MPKAHSHWAVDLLAAAAVVAVCGLVFAFVPPSYPTSPPPSPRAAFSAIADPTPCNDATS